MKKKILVAGVLAFDTLETPFGKKEKIMGGPCYHCSIAASLFTEVELSAIVGEDYPQRTIAFMQKRGIGTSNVECAKGETFHWIAKYSGNMLEAETLATHLNVLPSYNPKLNEAGEKCEMLFLAALDPAMQSQVIDEAKGAKIIMCDTKGLWIDVKLDDLKKVIKRVDIFTVNEHEARTITNETNINIAVEKLANMGPKIILIKRGEYGSFVYKKGEPLFYIPAYPLSRVPDPTGAGDTFAGAFMGYLATCPDYNKFSEIKKAMIYGAAASSFIVEDFGSEMLESITMKDVQRRYDELYSMIKID